VVSKGVGKKSPKQLYLEHGLCLIPSSNDTDFFLSLFIKLLRARDKEGNAVIMVSYKCVKLIEQIKNAAWDPNTLKGSAHDRMKLVENHALDAFKYFLNMYGLNPGLLDPIKPGRKVTHHAKDIHDSYFEDEDIDKDDYPYDIVKREMDL